MTTRRKDIDSIIDSVVTDYEGTFRLLQAYDDQSLVWHAAIPSMIDFGKFANTSIRNDDGKNIPGRITPLSRPVSQDEPIGRTASINMTTS